jgi:hypothetical protein
MMTETLTQKHIDEYNARSIMILATGHKEKCKDKNCEVILFLLRGLIVQLRGTELTDEEMDILT